MEKRGAKMPHQEQGWGEWLRPSLDGPSSSQVCVFSAMIFPIGDREASGRRVTCG